MRPSGRRSWAAEAAGTGLLMLAGLSVIAFVLGAHSPLAGPIPSESTRLLVVGLGFGGCVSLIAISPLGMLSGAHLNPAVTLAFTAVGRLSRRDAAGYVAAQVGGALAGSLAFRVLWGAEASSVGGGVTHQTIGAPGAVALEAAMTALLVATILVFVSHERLARFTPLVIWLLIAVLVWSAGPLTGTSLNPARSAGPAAVFGDFADLWLYLVAPVAGALAVAAVWRGLTSADVPTDRSVSTVPRSRDPGYRTQRWLRRAHAPRYPSSSGGFSTPSAHSARHSSPTTTWS